MENWFGMNNGKYITEPPKYVNKLKLPGMTPIPQPTLTSWLVSSPFVLITSPNFIWVLISLFLYFYAPYNLSSTSVAAQSPISYNFMITRLPIWLTTTLSYFAFWHVGLYFYNLANRPFIKNRPYNTDKVIHNIFWTTSGIVIWTAVENVYCYLWATNRLIYISDSKSFSSFAQFLYFIAVMAGIPVWRSVHFYFAHRFLHYTPLYKQVHSLHHRNTDPEPFSGLCMHPVEHLYYYSCVLPSLIFNLSPYAFLWNGVHLLLAPAASHSGWEDHFQSDTFHYLHHRFFECNYAGSDAAFMDIWFGTFKESLPNELETTPREDAKSTLRVIPTNEFITYLSLSISSLGPWYYYSYNQTQLTYQTAVLSSLSAGFGPVFLAVLLTQFYNTTTIKPVKMSIFGNILHLSLGTLFCSFPVAYTCWLTLNKD